MSSPMSSPLSPTLLVLLSPLWLPVFAPIAITATLASYSLATLVYLNTAQVDNPERSTLSFLPNHPLPALPVHPHSVLLLSTRFIESTRFYISVIPKFAKYSYYKLLSSRSFNFTCYSNLYYNSFNSCNVYSPLKNQKYPVILFIYGGAWSSGNSLIYQPLAQTLVSQGYVVIVANYSLFPKAKVPQMIHDIHDCLFWIKKNIKTYNGDCNDITLMGHSAGAHLCALTVIHNAYSILERKQGVQEESNFTSHIPLFQHALPIVKNIVLLSGVYDIFKHLSHEKSRGVEQVSAMARANGHSITKFIYSSPTLLLQRYIKQDLFDSSTEDFTSTNPINILVSPESYPFFPNELNLESTTRRLKLADHLPRNWMLIHGNLDKTAPLSSTIEFHRELCDLQIEHLELKIVDVCHAIPVLGLMDPNSDYAIDFLDELKEFRSKSC